MHTIFKNNANAIVAARESIAEVLPPLWSSLDSVFGLVEGSESSPWSAYDARLLLFSILALKVQKEKKIKSIANIKETFSEAGIEGILWNSSLNIHSVLVHETSSYAVEIFTHKDIPFLFFHLYVYLDLIIEKFDAQAMSLAYFDFMLESGFISMNDGIIKVDLGKVVENGKKAPNLYGGLYEK